MANDGMRLVNRRPHLHECGLVQKTALLCTCGSLPPKKKALRMSMVNRVVLLFKNLKTKEERLEAVFRVVDELKNAEEREELFDELSGNWCTDCGEELPDRKSKKPHECKYTDEELEGGEDDEEDEEDDSGDDEDPDATDDESEGEETDDDA